jgi:hypothetical protein
MGRLDSFQGNVGKRPLDPHAQMTILLGVLSATVRAPIGQFSGREPSRVRRPLNPLRSEPVRDLVVVQRLGSSLGTSPI